MAETTMGKPCFCRIPNDVLPIQAGGDAFLNGALFESATGAFSNELPPIEGYDGRSHFVVDHWENNTFARPDLTSLLGDYEYHIAVRDAHSNGYDVVATFGVVPEPSTMLHFGLGQVPWLAGPFGRGERNRTDDPRRARIQSVLAIKHP